MGRMVDGGAQVGGGKRSTSATTISFSGTLKPKRKVSFVEELQKLAKYYGLKVELSGGYEPKSGSKRK